MAGIKHSHQTAFSNDPTKDVSATVWNAEHSVDAASLTSAMLAAFGSQAETDRILASWNATAKAHNLLSAIHGDTVAASPVLGDVLAGNSTPAWDKVAGNITTTRKFLRQTGNATISALPAWDTLLIGDIPTAYPYANLNGTPSTFAPSAHKANHISGGSDAFASTDVLEGIIKKIQETAGPTTLSMGAVADGQYLKRSGSTVVGVDRLNKRITGSDTATSVGTNSTGLTLSLLASTNYAFKAFVYFTSPTSGTSTTNFQIHVLAAGAALVIFECYARHTGIGVLADDIAGITPSVTTNVLGTVLVNSLTYYVIMSGIVTVGGTPTTLQIDQVAAATNGATKIGSFVEADAIA